MARTNFVQPTWNAAISGVRATCWTGTALPSFSSGGSTSSPAIPRNWTLLVSYTKARRSLLPALPRVTSETRYLQRGPSRTISRSSARRSALTSWSATRSKRSMISAMYA